MTHLRKLGRACGVALLALVVAVSMPATAEAQKKKKEEEAPTKSYVFPYILVMMITGLGLMTICRPSSRKERVDEKKKEEEV
ncbi:MAG: hypothetical protein DWQ37_21355 [Planctomycetota bacterium]|nr:MAG: hypothetical protein DWQ37_21355 [Planctomycetota bacterium]